tara:strand:- start:1586 stop:1840 length:255 start_codon:yes stop_codon:yes gene_type:complete
MIYDYYCEKCGDRWEQTMTIATRNDPVGTDCPCGEKGSVKKGVSAPGLNFQGAISPIRRAGTGWNDILKGIKKASGKENTIEHL